MILYPAIDLLEGKCVRLFKGDFKQSTVYMDEPLLWAKELERSGTEWLHVVDLDGAKNPDNRQTALITNLVNNTNLRIQTGGGVRSEEDVEILLNAGASRVVVGSMAVKDKEATIALLEKFGADSIVLALDVKKDGDGVYKAAVSGWQESSDKLLTVLVSEYLEHGLKHVLCTDIERDGTMEGPNVALYEILGKQFPGLQVQASGGVKALEDLVHLKNDTNVAGVIVGKAIYEGAFTVQAALETIKAA